jgi:hypothetical protein
LFEVVRYRVRDTAPEYLTIKCRGLYPERSGGEILGGAETRGPERFGYKALK